jgi:outer membrane protein with beta-barrel domain
MRTHLLTVVVCLLAGAGPASAQSGAHGGVIGGPGWTTLSTKSDTGAPDFGWGGGMAAGVYVITPSSHGIALEPEFLVSVKRSNALIETADTTVRLTSLEMPVMLRVGPSAAGRAGLHLLVGPTFNVRLSARQTIEQSGQTIETDANDQAERWMVGFAAGAGVDVSRVRIDGRFTWALTNLNTDTSDHTSIKDRAFTVMAGLRLW